MPPSVILEQTWRSEECTQKRFWNFRHISGLLAKVALLYADSEFMILSLNTKPQKMKHWKALNKLNLKNEI